MTQIAAGSLDRRVRIEVAAEVRDAAGDVVREDWAPPPGWPTDGKRWASKVTLRGGGVNALRGVEVAGSAQQLLREADTVFTLRWDRYSTQIAPETFRVVHRDRAYLIVAKVDSGEREDGIVLLCSSRPDMRGSAGPVSEDQQSSGES